MLLASCNVLHYVERESSLTFISEYHNTQLPLQYVLRIYSNLKAAYFCQCQFCQEIVTSLTIEAKADLISMDAKIRT